MQISAEVMIILDEVLREWGQQMDDEGMREEMLEELYERLDVAMFAEILTHLSGKYLAAFVRMNEEKRSREEIDIFLQENMPDADQVIAGACAKFREFYVRIGERRKVSM
jgi:hypothetical protein